MTRAFVEVAALVPVRGTFSYEVPERLRERALVGARVLVPLGGRGVTGVVLATAAEPPPELERVRAVDAVLDAEPVVSAELLALCAWVAEYYEAPVGEVLRAALPAGSAVTATQKVELTEAGRRALAGEGAALTRRQRELLAALHVAGGALGQTRLVRGRGRVADVAALVEAGLAEYARVAGRARVAERTERIAVVCEVPDDEQRRALDRAPKRKAIYEALETAGGALAVVALRQVDARAATHVRSLSKAGLVRIEERAVAPGVAQAGAGLGSSAPVTPPALNPAQRAACDAIGAGLAAGEFAAYVLFGVTGSGKTEVYLHVIAEALAAGGGAIVLVPEISLTPLLASRFRARFGDDVAVLHSGLTDRERFDEWSRLRTGAARIALGARSAIFAPVANLRVVVVDEEHDSSFKQEEGVRYNARDVALVRTQRAGGVCVLGSATPSLESFHAARAGRYHLLPLPQRATPRPLPAVEVVDLRSYQASAEELLTAPLAAAIEENLARGEQVILFLNRRGFATFVLCRACGHAFRCPNCAVSLTYHRFRDRMLCHYCGHAERVPERCPKCAAEAIDRRGLGTERVADAIATRFEGARVARLDRDVASGSKVEAVLARVARREVDILVGTQMVTKGHDFPGVTLVGVLCADTGLSLPDFRASERTFQLLTQVAGRAGRGDRPGRVLIQTFRPTAVAVAAAAAQDYEGFFAAECEIRQELSYPPFGHLIALRIDGENAHAVEQTARNLAAVAHAHGGVPVMRAASPSDVSVLGPAEAPLSRLKGRTRWQLWLRGADRRQVRHIARAIASAGAEADRGVRVTVDVDPISAL